MKTQKQNSRTKILIYGLLTGAAMSAAFLLATSGLMAEKALPKFLVPLATFIGILLFLNDRFWRKTPGVKYFQSLEKAFQMSSVAFLSFSPVLYSRLVSHPPHWMTHLQISATWVTAFSTLTGIALSLVLVLILLPAFKRKQSIMKAEQKRQAEASV